MIRRRRVAARRLVSEAIALLAQEQLRRLPLAERIARVGHIASGASRELIMQRPQIVRRLTPRFGPCSAISPPGGASTRC